MLSRTAENYLRIIHDTIQRKGEARPKDLVKALDVSAPSVTEMLQRLAKEGLIGHEKRGEITLTEKGLRKALSLKVRYQVFLKLFKMAGVSSATAYKDACSIEDKLSGETTEKLIEFMERLEKTMLCKRL